jgi:YHS domain-containing protein
MTFSRTAATLGAALLSISLHAQQPSAPPEVLDGVDPVMLLETGKESFGTSAFTSTHGRFTYLFASAASKAAFDAAPEKFAVQSNGSCARMGGAIPGNPSNYAVVGGRIYLFASDDCRKRFVAAPAKFIAVPPAPMPATKDAVGRGQALLEKAVLAHGGAKLDALTSYVETHRQAPPPGTPGPPAEMRLSWRFPDAARLERHFVTSTDPPRPAVTATLVTTEGAWLGRVDGSSALRRVAPEGAAQFEMSAARAPVALFRTRHAKGTSVAWIGTATMQGTTLEQVRLIRGGIDVTLTIDPGTGRLHSMAFVGRNHQAEIGLVSLVFGDYRDVSGILVPFAEKGTFDGVPADTLSRTLESVEVNVPLDPALFHAGAR